MLTIDQIKSIGIPKNISKLNNSKFLDAAIPNNSVNLYEAITTVLAQDNISFNITTEYFPTSIALSGETVASATSSLAGVMSSTDKISLTNLISLVGTSNANLGTFTGNIIPDNQTVKQALQAIETNLELGKGIYKGSGSIPNNTTATVASNGVFFINYANATAAFGISDINHQAFISSSDGNYSVYSDNTGSYLKGATNTIEVKSDGSIRIVGSGIGVNATAASNVAFQIDSTTKTFVLPRMSTTQRNAISSPLEGSMVYNTTTKKLNLYTGSAWEAITSS